MPPTVPLNHQARTHRARRDAMQLASRLGCEIRTVALPNGSYAFYTWPRPGVEWSAAAPAEAHSWEGLLGILQRAAR